MSWTRLDDLWTEQRQIRQLSFEARFHYLSMIQFCSRSRQYDGHVLTVDAERVSDVPDPRRCLSEIVTVGLLRATSEGFVVVAIDEHIPPPYLRDNHAKERSREASQAWRLRKCEAGDHSKDCPAKTCPAKQAKKLARDQSRNEVSDQTRQDRTGQDKSPEAIEISSVVQAPVVAVPEPRVSDETLRRCESCGNPSSFLDGGRCRRDECRRSRAA